MKSNIRWSAAAAAALLFVGVAPAVAQDDAAGEAEDVNAELTLEEEIDTVLAEEAAEEKKDKPWSVSGSIRTSVGQGTFVRPSNDTEFAGEIHDGRGAYNRVNLVFGIAPSYTVGDFSFSGSIALLQWLTAGGGINGPYETRLQDLSFGAGWKGHTFESTGIRLTPSVSLTFPTSAVSRTTTMIVDTGASVGLSRNFFGRLTLSYGLSGSKTFHQYTSPVVNIERIGVENAIYRIGGAEDVEPGRIAIEGYNSEYMVGNALSASMRLWGDFSASASYGIYTYWTYYANNDDEFASEYSCTGRCTSQITSNALALSYRLNDWVGLRASLNTAQPPKTADNKSFRFPFWNFGGAAANYSSIQFAVSGSY
jgi:hypothetical protein